MNISDLTSECIQRVGFQFAHPGDVVYLGRTCRWMRDNMSYVCFKIIERAFGKDFLGKRDPIALVATLWGHFTPKSFQLRKWGVLNDDLLNKDEIKELFQIIKNGTTKELKEKLAKIPREELFQTPGLLSTALSCATIEKAELLINSNVSMGYPLSEPSCSPLYQAVLKGNIEVFKFLIDHGASVTKKHFICGKVEKTQIMDDVFLKSNIYFDALRVRAYISEVTLEIAFKYLCNILYERLLNGDMKIVKLLMAYGIKPICFKIDGEFKVLQLTCKGNQEALEMLHQLGLDYQTFRYNGFSLADAALIGGQFELEKFLSVHQVEYLDKERSIRDRDERFLLGHRQDLNWERILTVIDHYKIDINQQFDGYTLLYRLSNRLLFADVTLKTRVSYLTRIIDLMERGADLDILCCGNTARNLLIEAVPRLSVEYPELVQKFYSLIT